MRIPDDEQDKHLADKLQQELPGILAWCVRGCLLWQRDGLTPPPEVQLATQEYRDENDSVQRFLAECCTAIAGATIPQVLSSDLYDAYKRWCEQESETAMSKIALGRTLTQKGFAEHRSSVHHNKQFRQGIDLNAV